MWNVITVAYAKRLPGNRGRRAAWLTEHDRVMGGLLPIPCLRSNPIEDEWDVVTDDLTHWRPGSGAISFRQVVGPGAKWLTDEDCIDDLLTAKLLVYHALAPGGWSSSATSTKNMFKALLTFFRWRDASGIRSTGDLTRAWFRDFEDRIRGGGVGRLIPAAERAKAWRGRVLAGEMPLPMYDIGRGRLRPAINSVAQEIGFTESRSLPPEAELLVLKTFSDLVPDRVAAKTTKGMDALLDLAVLPAGGLTDHHAAALLAPWEKLWRLREVMSHDPIRFDAFGGASAWTHAKGLATREAERTPDIPPLQACHLADRALRWVVEYYPDIRRWAEVATEWPDGDWDQRTRHLEKMLPEMRFETLSPDAPGAPWNLIPVYNLNSRNKEYGGKDGLCLHDLLFLYLPAACSIVIATFSARRHEEIASLRDDSLEADGEGRPWLRTWVSKSLRELDRIPVPRAVALALEVLAWLSERTRAEVGDRWLYSFSSLMTGGKVAFKMNDAVNAFADLVSVPPLPDGQRWRFAAHQFRRFFGLVYFHRYRYPSLVALSRFYGHADCQMTRTYVTKAVPGAYSAAISAPAWGDRDFREAKAAALSRREDFEKERVGYIVARLGALCRGEERVGGRASERMLSDLQSLVDEATGQLVVASEDEDPGGTLTQLLVAFAQGRSLEPHPDGHSHCTCTGHRQDLSIAGCLALKKTKLGPDACDNDTGPDMAYAIDEACCQCPLNLTLEGNGDAWASKVTEEELLAERALGDAVRRSATRRAKLFRDHHARAVKGARHVARPYTGHRR